MDDLDRHPPVPQVPVPVTGERPASVAVIGGGVAGLTAAHIAARHARITLFEADDRLGGHAHTQYVTLDDGSRVAVDTGFIVHNDRTYPTLLTLFDELGIATTDTDMSMSVRSEISGLEYAGALGLSGLFPTMRTLTRGRYLRMLVEITRFHRAARRVLDAAGDDIPLSEFVDREGFSDYFRDNFLLPLVAAVWSCESHTAAAYPARYLFTFLDHHGMLTVFGSPTWRTVRGGSVQYVDAVADGVRARGGTIRLSAPVRRITESADGVTVTTDDAVETFDAVVVATHPHQALAMLTDPGPLVSEVLGSIRYAAKPAVLHTDTWLLPRAEKARASWNYQIRDDGRGPGEIAVTYDLTRLMRLAVAKPRLLVTMGRTDLVDPAQVLAEMTYEHPVYTVESVAAQARLPEIDSSRVVFAGAYHGWGFHEDGAASGARAAARLGLSWTDQPEHDRVATP
ncbi:FAD-dependent oxidoreductase [Gordonia sp. ABSL1-1]|uniref:NAD(P)/FAD-dependent oxidoreductase n=1 Tax=Gordonia sp. ABSL1-1 TaxID=3053923 RepID=UPI002573E4EC|nr:FAD-dependent oxidoreductase [Gordonia sp. ABSL1-1]MDL9935409.1 FAD-dependent oxidoreductase [Gordonia sp. ABSL1-1]